MSKISSWLWRTLSLVMGFMIAFSPLLLGPVAAVAQGEEPADPASYVRAPLGGPSGAPSSLELPAGANLPSETVYIDKTVSLEKAARGELLEYNIDLINFNKLGAAFEFKDLLPEQVGYLTATLQISGQPDPIALDYDPISHTVKYSGTLPLGNITDPNLQGFEEGMMPPTNWQAESLGPSSQEWEIMSRFNVKEFIHSGVYAAWLHWDSFEEMDEWLYSAPFTPTVADSMASFWAIGDTVYPGATVTVYAVDPQGGFQDQLWDMVADENWDTFVYRHVTLDLSAYMGQEIQLVWRYHGLDGDSFGLDDVYLPGNVQAETIINPSATASITVELLDTALTGETVTNTAYLTATYQTAGQPVVETVQDSAAFQVVEPGFEDSYKQATPYTLPGDLILYDLHVINSGDTAAEVTLSDPIPADTTYVAHSAGPGSEQFSYNETLNQMEWSGSVAPGEDRSLFFTVEADAGLEIGDLVTNTASLVWNEGTLDLVATTEIEQPILAIDKAGPDAAYPGDPITYTISFTNTGTITATGVILTDTLPVDVTSTMTPTFEIGDLGPGETMTVTLQAMVSELAPCAQVLVNRADISDTSGERNADIHETRLLCRPNYFIPALFKDYNLP